MLIVAMPKTASTSLMKALGDLLDWQARQRVNGLIIRRLKDHDKSIHPDFTTWWTELPRRHGDCFEWNDTLERWVYDEEVHKQHIIPSVNNLAHIGTKYVFLHRNPVEIVQAYARQGKGRKPTRNPVMMVKELDRYAKLHIDNMPDMVVEYKALIINPRRVINRILDLWGVTAKYPRGWELPQERFTGFTPPAGSTQAPLHFMGERETQ